MQNNVSLCGVAGVSQFESYPMRALISRFDVCLHKCFFSCGQNQSCLSWTSLERSTLRRLVMPSLGSSHHTSASSASYLPLLGSGFGFWAPQTNTSRGLASRIAFRIRCQIPHYESRLELYCESIGCSEFGFKLGHSEVVE